MRISMPILENILIKPGESLKTCVDAIYFLFVHLMKNPLVQILYRRIFSLYDSTVLKEPGRFFSFLILYTVSRIPWTGDQPTTYTQNNTDTE
jgi:hypothetical protein